MNKEPTRQIVTSRAIGCADELIEARYSHSMVPGGFDVMS